jgi:hypothetical protein
VLTAFGHVHIAAAMWSAFAVTSGVQSIGRFYDFEQRCEVPRVPRQPIETIDDQLLDAARAHHT